MNCFCFPMIVCNAFTPQLTNQQTLMFGTQIDQVSEIISSSFSFCRMIFNLHAREAANT